MPFVNAKCPNCGGSLQVDNGKRVATCPFCKEAYIVEDAINNFVTNYNTNIEHCHADNVTFNVNPDFEIRAGELIRYNGASAEVVIPRTASKIGSRWDHGTVGAFQGCSSLKSVVIPNSITEIGDNAFTGCATLTSLHIPDSVVKIGSSAFCGCKSLRKIKLPNALTEIERGLFFGCTNLEEVIIPEGVTRISDNAFTDCKSLTTIILPSTLYSIGNYAFFHCDGLRSITIPDTVMYISEDAFTSCQGLQEITIPDNNRYWYGCAFNDCTSLEKVNVTGSGSTSQVFRGSPYQRNQIIKERIMASVCTYCGGRFKTFSKVCKDCGRKKAY